MSDLERCAEALQAERDGSALNRTSYIASGSHGERELIVGASSGIMEKRMANGDIYVGSWKCGLPNGKGKYFWSDGCMYEGDWVSGKATGRGKMSWPSGATYEGDFSGGFIQGIGTFIGHGTTLYKGSWLVNVEHGLGRKCYSNGDMYEGLWKQGVHDGPGKYTWKNGNTYFGDWKGGAMTGLGCLTWANKDSYHGMWLNGSEHGHGTYTWAEGSCYIGVWSQGLKDGRGIFYPSGTKPSRNLSFSGYGSTRSQEETGEDELISSSQVGKSRAMYPLKKSESLASRHVVVERRRSLDGPGYGFSLRKGAIEAQLDGRKLPILEREYAQGVLISEFVKESVGSRANRRDTHFFDSENMNLKRPGETIIKGHKSYDLMLNLQLGIRYCVGLNKETSEGELRPSDFGPKAKLHIKFPRTGSQHTPSHQSIDFEWRDYCPMVFRKIRKVFKIKAADYVISICGNDAPRELSSPGKSGSIFYLSHDDRYIIKTLRRNEVKVLLKMLPQYLDHICNHENTLITKFFGLHQVTPIGGRKIRVVVMGNVFCTEVRIHRRFDLKGSLQGRSTDKVKIDETTVLKDLDLDFLFYLEPLCRQTLFEQIHQDCAFLESQRIMDYSLLLGLHFRAPQFLVPQLSQDPNLYQQHNALPGIQEDQIYPKGLVLVSHDHKGGILFGPHVRGSPLKAASVGHEEVDLMILGMTNSRLQVRLGVNMPARAERRPMDLVMADCEDNFVEVYDVILCCGIIDVLQKYSLAKRIEHAYKSLKFSPESISAVHPTIYSRRFQKFINKAFPECLQ